VCVSVAHRTHDGVDGVVAGASELFYGDLGSSTADYRAVGRAIGPWNSSQRSPETRSAPTDRDFGLDLGGLVSYNAASRRCRAVGLSELRRGGTTPTTATGSLVAADPAGCASCLTCDPTGKQRTVVCTVQNTRTATLVHRLDAPAAATGTCQYGYASNGGTAGRALKSTADGRLTPPAYTAAAKHEIYCHSPYCVYATSGTSRRLLQSFKSRAPPPPTVAAAPDVAPYGCVGGQDDDRCAVEDEGPGEAEEGRRTTQGDAAERWLRGDGNEGAPSCREIWARGSLDLTRPHPKRHLDRFIRFYRVRYDGNDRSPSCREIWLSSIARFLGPP